MKKAFYLCFLLIVPIRLLALPISPGTPQESTSDDFNRSDAPSWGTRWIKTDGLASLATSSQQGKAQGTTLDLEEFSSLEAVLRSSYFANARMDATVSIPLDTTNLSKPRHYQFIARDEGPLNGALPDTSSKNYKAKISCSSSTSCNLTIERHDSNDIVILSQKNLSPINSNQSGYWRFRFSFELIDKNLKACIDSVQCISATDQTYNKNGRFGVGLTTKVIFDDFSIWSSALTSNPNSPTPSPSPSPLPFAYDKFDRPDTTNSLGSSWSVSVESNEPSIGIRDKEAKGLNSSGGIALQRNFYAQNLITSGTLTIRPVADVFFKQGGFLARVRTLKSGTIHSYAAGTLCDNGGFTGINPSCSLAILELNDQDFALLAFKPLPPTPITPWKQSLTFTVVNSSLIVCLDSQCLAYLDQTPINRSGAVGIGLADPYSVDNFVVSSWVPGDINSDRCVNLNDYIIWSDSFDKLLTPPVTLLNGDINNDGIVTLSDLKIMISYKGQCNLPTMR